MALACLSLLGPAQADEAPNRPMSIQVPQGLAGGPEGWTSPEGLSSTLQVMLLLTVLSLAPAVLLMTTCFVRIIVVLSLLRQAVGTQQLPPSQVITALGPVHDPADHVAGVEAGLRPGHRPLYAPPNHPGPGLDGGRAARSAAS